MSAGGIDKFNKKSKSITKILLCLTVVSVILLSAILCGCNNGNDIKTLERDVVLHFDTDKCFVGNLPYIMATDTSKTYIEMKKNGEIAINIKLIENLIYALSNTFGIDINGKIQGLNIKSLLADGVVYSVFPGLNLDDLKGSAELFEKAFGITITGIDFDDPEIVKLQRSITETGKIPEDFVIPEGLGAQLNETYELKDFLSELTGETYQAVYIGRHSENCEPYFVLTLLKDDNGKYRVIYENKVINLTLCASEIGYAG